MSSNERVPTNTSDGGQNLLNFTKFIFKEMRQWHCGNAFSQVQHDGGSRHGVKYQVLAMQRVPPGLDKNLVLCIGLDVLVDSKGDTVALGLDDASFNVL